MVNYKNLIPGKKYKLGDIKVGKFVRFETEANDDNVLIFLDSQYGDKGENTIYPDDQDDFIEIKAMSVSNKKKSKSKSKNRGKGGKRKNTFRKR
jgi:hypothetical protein